MSNGKTENIYRNVPHVTLSQDEAAVHKGEVLPCLYKSCCRLRGKLTHDSNGLNTNMNIWEIR